MGEIDVLTGSANKQVAASQLAQRYLAGRALDVVKRRSPIEELIDTYGPPLSAQEKQAALANPAECLFYIVPHLFDNSKLVQTVSARSDYVEDGTITREEFALTGSDSLELRAGYELFQGENGSRATAVTLYAEEPAEANLDGYFIKVDQEGLLTVSARVYNRSQWYHVPVDDWTKRLSVATSALLRLNTALNDQN